MVIYVSQLLRFPKTPSQTVVGGMAEAITSLIAYDLSLPFHGCKNIDVEISASL